MEDLSDALKLSSSQATIATVHWIFYLYIYCICILYIIEKSPNLMQRCEHFKLENVTSCLSTHQFPSFGFLKQRFLLGQNYHILFNSRIWVLRSLDLFSISFKVESLFYMDSFASLDNGILAVLIDDKINAYTGTSLRRCTYSISS